MKFGFDTVLDRAWLLLDEGATRLHGALANPVRVDRQRPSLDVLEDRLLFSATPMAAIAELAEIDDSGLQTSQVAHQFETEATGESDGSTTSDSAESTTAKQLVFIDSAVADLDALTSDLAGDDSRFAVFVLDAERDGIDQISEILADHRDVAGIHIVSHGEDGQIKLGQTWLGIDAMDGYAGQIAQWSGSLAEGADLLIYGCDLAATSDGRAMIDAIAALCNCDVAASDDDTGNAAYGADWELEYTTGQLQTDVAFSESLQANWLGKLAVITVDTTADVIDGGDGLTSLREAIIATNSGAGGDTIQLSAGTYQLTISGDENDSNQGDLDIKQSVTIVGAGAGATIIDGGGIDRVFHTRGNTTVATISDVTIQGGANDSNGGGIFVDQESTLNLIDSIVQGNDGGADRGGGVHVHGTFNANRVLFTNNTAQDGGAIYYHGAEGGSLVNVTISGNVATADGGGLWTDTAIEIVNATITANDAHDGGGLFVAAEQITLSNTIVAGNTTFTGEKDVAGDFISDGSNLIQVVGSATGLGGDITGVDPQLAVLANYGGSTPTHMPHASSAAINAGTTTGAPTVDQRGVARDASPDIGAVERVATELTATTETRVNTTTGDTQQTSGQARGNVNSIALADNGNYVVVWSSDNQDGSGWGVYGRLYAADGTPRTDEFLLNTETSDDQVDVSVASDAAGNFVATWTSSEQDGSGDGIYAQRFDTAGNKIGTEILVNTSTLRSQRAPIVSVDRATGDFVIVWNDVGVLSQDVVAQKFDASGAKQGPTEIVVARMTLIGTPKANVAMLDGGGYAVAWEELGNIRVQKYGASGTTYGALLTPENSFPISAGMPDLAVHSDGSMVVVWSESDTTIKMLRYDSAGNTIGGTRTVNSTAGGTQQAPVVDIADDGSFIVAWEGQGSGDSSGVFAQKYNADGTANGGEFRINQTTAGTQSQVSIAAIDDKNYVAVWTGAGPGDTEGVFVRQFNDQTNTAPTAVAGGPYTIDEGDSLTLDGSGSIDADLDTLQYAWDLNNDGTFGETTALQTATPTLSWSDLQSLGIANDGVYTIALRVSDGRGGVSTSTTTVTVANIAPTITSPTAVSVDENTTPVQTVTATDPVDPVVYSISGGSDSSRFTIDANTGVLAFVSAPDAEAPTDAGGNNQYDVEVTASDSSGGSHVATIRVTVNDLNDTAPTIANPPLIGVSELATAGTTVANLSATDPDSGTTLQNWTITDGNADGIFAIDANTGRITIANTTNLDFESTTGYSLSVTVSDGVNTSAVQAVSIAIEDANDNVPVIAAGQQFSVTAAAPNNTLLGTLTASDLDASSTVLQNWTIVDGNIGNAFSLDATTGELRVQDQTALDATATPVYTLRVTVSDGVNASTIETVRIDVTPTMAPIAGDDSYTLSEGGTLDVDVVADWHNASWHQRQQLTFNNTASGSNLTDFAVLVKLHATAADAIAIDYSTTQDQGQDLLFYDSDGTLLSHEIQSWDESGYSYVWVRVPQIDAGSGSDSIWMYYDNPDAPAIDRSGDTWTAADLAVLHLDGSLQDSSIHANHGSGTASASPAGIVDSAASFNGTNSTVSLGSASSLDDIFEGGATISVWINAEDWGGGNYGRIVDKASSHFGGGSSNGDGWALEVGNQGTPGGFLLFNQGFTGGEAEWRTDVGSIQLNTWHHVALVYDSNSAAVGPQIYIDGVLQNLNETRTASGTARSDAAIDMTVGNYAQDTSRAFDGLIDELRISDQTRTADQINAERLQGLGLFVNAGPVETGPGGLLANDRDPEGQVLQISLLDGPANAASFNLAADGSFSYLHDGSETTADSFTYTLTDASGVSTVGTVRLTITPVNDAPTAYAGGTYTIQEGSSLLLDGSPSADIDNPIVSFAWDLDGDGIYGEVGEAVGSQANVDWDTLRSHGISNNGSYTIGLQVTDAAGLTATAHATLIVNNAIPVAVNDAGIAFTTDEGTAFVTGNVLSNDSDPNALDAVTIVSFDASGLLGSLTHRGDGSFEYDPNGQLESLGQGEQYVGTFTYTIDDGDGGLASAVVTIIVHGSNDAPSLNMTTSQIGYVENQGPTQLIQNITLSDVDGTTLQSARIWFSSGYAAGEDKLQFSDTATIHGSWDEATSTLTLTGTDTRENYQTAIESIHYQNLSESPSTAPRVLAVQVDDGNAQSQIVARNIAVTSVNDAPVGQNDTFEVIAGESLTGQGVLLNDLDVDGDSLTATLIDGPSNGTLTLLPDGTFSYQPDLEFAGVDRFTYVAVDGSEVSEPTEVLLIIAAANLSGGNVAVGEAGTSAIDSSSSALSESDPVSESINIVESALAAGNSSSQTDDAPPPQQNEAAAIDILVEPSESDDDDGAVLGLGILVGDDEQFTWTPQVQRQTITLHRDVEKAAANDSQANRNDDSHNTAVYELIAHPGTAWQEMDAFRSQIDGQLYGNAITVTTVGITGSSFALGYITWVMRSGFILTGLLANMPIWRSFDPLVVISGMSHEGNAETIQEIITREKQILDETAVG
ncbi:putative outer membrane protein PmpB precursor [Rosistilla oblonga]|uniref:DUF2341 domain-containing protein n=1 Tax=Rosistilla oblonga TaxID=2527990 RepID=UPI00118840A0|nr:DUF2341 domain-containing protein [Rosistilla oblonga]QDV13024.1 putative outer membrane protein PmpB precursor [Rosistilla oblonga]